MFNIKWGKYSMYYSYVMGIDDSINELKKDGFVT